MATLHFAQNDDLLTFVTKRYDYEIEPLNNTLYICKSKKKDAIMGSVNWQKSDYYKSLKDYEKQTGLSLAERNYLQNPNGNHSTWGVLGVSLFTGLFNMGLDYATEKINGSQDTGSKTDVGGSTNVIHSFNEAKRKYDSAVAKDDNEGILKYAQELQKIGEEHKGEPVIDRGYGMIKSKIEAAAKKKTV